MSKWKQVSSLVRSKAIFSLLPTRYTFIPNKEEVIESRFRLRYSTTCNSYYRDWSDAIDPSSQGVLPGWDKHLYSVDSVHRHINEEAGQVYLERVPGSDTGCVKWHFDFGCCGLLVDEVTLRLSCVEDFGGEVVVILAGAPGQQRVRYPPGSDYVTYNQLENASQLTLAVHFVGEANQITRLFPQSILRGMGYPLDLQVTLKADQPQQMIPRKSTGRNCYEAWHNEPPLQSLGKPRILVGLLYSSSQEIQVDSRHYKKNSDAPGREFLHIHLLRGRDLPSGKNSPPETFSKCYLLPDAKKTTKCRTRAKKGKDPLWNEQFLLVGLNYHDTKRRALEICVADSRKQAGSKARIVGGVRLSLGHEAVVAAQTKRVHQVLAFLKGKGGVGECNKQDNLEPAPPRRNTFRSVSFSEDTINNLKSESTRNKDVEKREVINKLRKEVNDEKEKRAAKDKEREVDVEDLSVKSKHAAEDPSTTETEETERELSPSSARTEDLSVAWNSGTVSSPDSQRNHHDTRVECSTEPISKVETKASVSTLTSGNDTEHRVEHAAVMAKEIVDRYESQNMAIQLAESGCYLARRIDTTVVCDSQDIRQQEAFPEKDKEDGEKDTQKRSSCLLKEEKSPLTTRQKGGKDSIIEPEKRQTAEMDRRTLNKQEENKFNSKGKETITDLESRMTIPNEVTFGDSVMKGKTTLHAMKKENEDAFNQKVVRPVEEREDFQSAPLKDSLPRGSKQEETSDIKRACAEASDIKQNPSHVLKDISKRLSFRKSTAADKETSKNGVDGGVESNANNLMLDGEGLEIRQWQNVVERPNQWHYCWHILRLDMTPLH